MCVTLETTYACRHSRFSFHGCAAFDNGEDRPFDPPDSEMCRDSRDEARSSARLCPACQAEMRRREAQRRADGGGVRRGGRGCAVM